MLMGRTVVFKGRIVVVMGLRRDWKESFGVSFFVI